MQYIFLWAWRIIFSELEQQTGKETYIFHINTINLRKQPIIFDD